MTNAAPQGGLPALAELDALLQRMRESGEIDAVGEGVLRRHFEERAATLAEDFRVLLQEYEQRVQRDGEAAAEQWLAESSRALGSRDREHTQRVLSTVAADPNSLPH